jgi:hypothetical protein
VGPYEANQGQTRRFLYDIPGIILAPHLNSKWETRMQSVRQKTREKSDGCPSVMTESLQKAAMLTVACKKRRNLRRACHSHGLFCMESLPLSACCQVNLHKSCLHRRDRGKTRRILLKAVAFFWSFCT